MASFGFCASQHEHYFGFIKGHLLTSVQGQVIGFGLTSANIDDRQMVFELTDTLQNQSKQHTCQLFSDKGYLSKDLQSELAKADIDLQTPLRDNMTDDRDKGFLSHLKKSRKIIETVISQLSQRLNIQQTKARDL